MLTDRYDPVDVFALAPQLSLQMEPELAPLDRLLDDDVLFQAMKADLGKRYPQTLVRGRHSTPVEVMLRMLIVKRLYGFSSAETEYWVGDSLRLRQFCRLGLHRPPDDTTLIRWANVIAPATVVRLNERGVELARQRKVTRGRKLRVDSTLVETNVHHPTDGSLLADGVRVLSRLLRRAKEEVGEAAGVGKRAFASHTRHARQFVRVIHGLARRVREASAAPQKAQRRGNRATATEEHGQPAAPAAAPGETRAQQPRRRGGKEAMAAPVAATGETAAEKKRKSAQEAMKAAYEQLIAVTQQSVGQAERVCRVLQEPPGPVAARLREQMEGLVPRVKQVIAQAQRRVIAEEAVPAKEKVGSLFEPHTQIVKRGKSGRVVEFGRKVMLDEVEGGIISGFRILDEPGSDAPYLKAGLENHQERFGVAPRLLTGDRGFSSPANEPMAKEMGVKRVAIPYAGKAPPERVKQEKERWFREGYRFRAGIEGRISVSKRRFGLERCRDHGEAGLGRWVGWGVVTSNLWQIARA